MKELCKESLIFSQPNTSIKILDSNTTTLCWRNKTSGMTSINLACHD